MFAVCAFSSRPTSSVTRPNTTPGIALRRHRRGDAPQRGLLVRQPTQRLLGGAALGDVADVAAEQRRTGQVGARDRQLDRELAAVLAHPRELDRMSGHAPVPGLDVAREPVAMGGAQRRRHDQRRQLAADHLRRRVPERPLRRLVDLDDVAAVVHRHDAVERGVEDRALARVALQHRLLRAAALDELADLGAEAAHRREQVVVQLAPLGDEELDHAEQARRAAHREREARAQPGGGGRRGAREAARRRRTSATHAGSCRRPHPAREPFSRAQLHGAALGRERVDAAARGPVHTSRHVSAEPSGSQTAPTSHASDSPTAASSCGYASCSPAADASTRDTACSVRSRTVTSER